MGCAHPLHGSLFDTTHADLLALERLLALPPEKFLELSTDQLLRGYFQGDGNDLALGTQEKRAQDEPNRSDTLTSDIKRTRVHENEGRTMTEKDPASTAEEEESHSSGGDGWLTANSNENLGTGRFRGATKGPPGGKVDERHKGPAGTYHTSDPT